MTQSHYCFSMNRENFFGGYSTRTKAFDAGCSVSDGQCGVIYTGRCVHPDLVAIMTPRVEDLIDSTVEDVRGKYAYSEQWMIKRRKDDFVRLVTRLAAVLHEYFSEIKFYEVEDIERHTVPKAGGRKKANV